MSSTGTVTRRTGNVWSALRARSMSMAVLPMVIASLGDHGQVRPQSGQETEMPAS
jgi:hypothetical protein